MKKVKFTRDTLPHEWQPPFQKGQVVELSDDHVQKWLRRGAVKVLDGSETEDDSEEEPPGDDGQGEEGPSDDKGGDAGDDTKKPAASGRRRGKGRRSAKKADAGDDKPAKGGN